jgi:hypothetical protein
MTTPNSRSLNSFPISHSFFLFDFWRLILFLCLWICAKLWGWLFQLWIMARLGLKKVVDWISAQVCKVKFKVSFFITPCDLLFHLLVLGVFLPMQVLFVPIQLLFLCKFFLFFFCKEGLKEIQPPLTMFLTTLDLIMFGFSKLCLICSMLQTCSFLCKRV